MTTVFCAVILVWPSLCHVPPSWKAGYSPSVLVAPSFQRLEPGQIVHLAGSQVDDLLRVDIPGQLGQQRHDARAWDSAPSGPV